MMHRAAHAPPYRHVSWCYDALSSAYSLGAIDRAKAEHHALIKPGDRVLYAGAGRGREIVGACLRGAEVTCIEPCPAMAARLHRRLSAVGDGFTVVPRPIQSIPAEPAYDLVVAHFFLNVFNTRAMPEVLAHLCGFVKPDGHLVIADFKPSDASTGRLTSLARGAYYRPVNVAGWLLRICALHPVYDYAPRLIEHGFVIESRQALSLMPGLPAMYDVIVAQRKKEPPSCDGG